jgi:hypothetical protein
MPYIFLKKWSIKKGYIIAINIKITFFILLSIELDKITAIINTATAI